MEIDTDNLVGRTDIDNGVFAHTTTVQRRQDK